MSFHVVLKTRREYRLMDSADTDLQTILAKFKDQSLHALVASIDSKTLINRILRNISNTDDRGLHIVQLAVDHFVKFCQLTPEKTLIDIEKVDRGSNKSFSNLPDVSNSRIANVYAFNESGRQERPDAVYKLRVIFPSLQLDRGLVVEIDGDEGKYAQPRQTATKMWEHLMYSKLVAGGGRSSIQNNGFTMRMFIARAEMRLSDKDEYESYTKHAAKWKKEKPEFWQKRCVAVLRALTGSVIFCLRNIFMCMMQQEDCWLYKTYKNQFHINIFIGPFTLNLPDTIVRGSDVFVEAQADNIAPAPAAAVQLPKKRPSKKRHRKLDTFVQNVEWSIDFRYANRSTCGETKVQYLLIENFQGLMNAPVVLTPAVAAMPAIYQSIKPPQRAAHQKYNCGLMSLTDILNTSEVFGMLGVTPKPGWKKRNYIKGNKKLTTTGAYKKWFSALDNMCYYMEDFILYHISDSIEWTKKDTWPMRVWMEDIAYALNSRGILAVTDTRAQYPMTPDNSDDNPQSLGRRLKQSLRLTLPALDTFVLEYMKTEGFTHIRDAELYLRLVGITNILALEQLARTHDTLLITNEYHARTFNSLALGTQSEMKVMFDRIAVNPHTTMDVLEILGIDCIDEDTPDPIGPIKSISRANQLMSSFVYKYIAMFTNEGETVDDWKVANEPSWTILRFLIRNARYFMTYGVYELARAWNNNIANFLDTCTDENLQLLHAKVRTFFTENKQRETGLFLQLKHVNRDTRFDHFCVGLQNIDLVQGTGWVQASETMPMYEISLGHIRLQQFIYCVCYQMSTKAERTTNYTHNAIISSLVHGVSFPVPVTSTDKGISGNKNVIEEMHFIPKMMLSIFSHIFNDNTFNSDSISLTKLKELIEISKNVRVEHLEPYFTIWNDTQTPDMTAAQLKLSRSTFRDSFAYVVIRQYIDFKSKNLTYNEVVPDATQLVDVVFSTDDETTSDSDEVGGE